MDTSLQYFWLPQNPLTSVSVWDPKTMIKEYDKAVSKNQPKQFTQTGLGQSSPNENPYQFNPYKLVWISHQGGPHPLTPFVWLLWFPLWKVVEHFIGHILFNVSLVSYFKVQKGTSISFPHWHIHCFFITSSKRNMKKEFSQTKGSKTKSNWPHLSLHVISSSPPPTFLTSQLNQNMLKCKEYFPMFLIFIFAFFTSSVEITLWVGPHFKACELQDWGNGVKIS